MTFKVKITNAQRVVLERVDDETIYVKTGFMGAKTYHTITDASPPRRDVMERLFDLKLVQCFLDDEWRSRVEVAHAGREALGASA